MQYKDRDNNQVLYPITHPQRRIWYIDKIHVDTPIYNIGGYLKIKGKIDLTILEEAIIAFIQSNDSVRLRMVERDGELRQYVSKFEKKSLDYYEFIDKENPIDEFSKWIEQEARKPFSLEDQDLFYFALFKLSDDECGYMAKFHHIIADGWSTNIMTHQICDFYTRIANGEEIEINTSYSYLDYIENENKYFNSDRFVKNKKFWMDKFNTLPDRIESKNSNSIEGNRKTYHLDSDLSTELKEFAKSTRFSINTILITLYLVYAYKTTYHNDMVIGLPSYNRSGFKEKNTFGMCTSTIPFRFILDSKMNLLEMLNLVHRESSQCYYNQKYPYDLLVKDLDLKRKGYDNLFTTCINYYNTKLVYDLNGCPIENYEFYNGNQPYSLQIIIKEWSEFEQITLEFDYKVSDFTEYQINDMYNCIVRLIRLLVHNPNETVANISLLSDQERKRKIFELNNTQVSYPKDKMIHQLFEEQVKLTPNKVAVSYEETEMTYLQLNEKANQLARYLIKNGVGREVLVGLLTTHSIESIVGILAILKAGATYVPIDINYPVQRVNYILEDSQCLLLLTNIELSESINFNGKIINLHNQDIYLDSSENLETMNQPSDMVYIIYTSGSTGKPKGTMIEHRGLVNYIIWAKKVYTKGTDEIFPLYSSLAFDLTVTSIFTPLISGCQIIVYSNLDGEDFILNRIVKENKATVVKLTPAHLMLLKDQDNSNSSIRRFIVGGDDLKVKLAKAIHDSFNGQVEIFNEYGPTETVVGCMIHKYDFEKDTDVSVPIGVPADNVQIYILDHELNPIGDNMIGELYISGDGVSRGYLGKKELTQEKFITNPFIAGARMYKTNDLARYLENGEIVYVGRADTQVKINGYRIELGEIESVLLSHDAIKNVAVLDIVDESFSKHICAYIVAQYEVDINNLREYLKERLPSYMIPVFFVQLDEIPLSVNGKVDRSALPKPAKNSNHHKDYSTRNEEVLTKVICNILMLERVSMTDNYYYIGGDSVKAIQISSRLRDEGYKIKVKDILENPVIEQMAQYVEYMNESRMNLKNATGCIKKTPIVSWFLSQEWSNINHYNQSVVLELKKDFDSEIIEDAFTLLMKQHDSLRINMNLSSGELFYNDSHLNKKLHIDVYNLSELSQEQQIEQMEKISLELKSSFNIETDILMKACVFSLSENNSLLMITAHHLVIDGVSWRIILEDLNFIIGKLYDKQEVLLPSKTSSLQEWAELVSKDMRNKADQEKNYWIDVVSHYYDVPTDFNLGDDKLLNCEILESSINEEETALLMTDANIAYNTQTQDLLIASLARTIKNFIHKDDIILELEGHGRDTSIDTIDITRTVGWFTTMYPFYVNLKEDDISNQLIKVKSALRNIPNNGMGYGILKYISNAITQENMRLIRFNYLGDFDQIFASECFDYSIKQSKNDISLENQMTAIIDINCFIKDKKLQLNISFSKNKYQEATIKQLQNDLMRNIKDIISHCCSQTTKVFTPDDFGLFGFSQEELDSLLD